MNLRNVALATFVCLAIVFALLAAIESDKPASTTTVTSFGTVYKVSTSTSVIMTNGSVTTITKIISLNGSEQFVLCEATTYSAAGTVTSGQTSNPTMTEGSSTYFTTTNETETIGYVTTTTQNLGPPTAPPWEVVTCTYVP